MPSPWIPTRRSWPTITATTQATRRKLRLHRALPRALRVRVRLREVSLHPSRAGSDLRLLLIRRRLEAHQKVTNFRLMLVGLESTRPFQPPIEPLLLLEPVQLDRITSLTGPTSLGAVPSLSRARAGSRFGTISRSDGIVAIAWQMTTTPWCGP
jgi:hypothetical protein